MMIYFQDADRDGSGSVDFKEFVELMIKREAEKETIDDLKQVFRVFDKVIYCKTYLRRTAKGDALVFTIQHKIQDGNGYVSTSEIKFVLKRSVFIDH